jgi:ABC-type glycerol-3-phosphate transport system substrate-binding protein
MSAEFCEPFRTFECYSDASMSRFAPFVLPIVGLAVFGAFVWGEELTKPEVPKDRIRITYWEKWTGFEYDGIKSIVDDFNKSQDKIFVDLLTISSIEQKTMMATAAGVPPDVAGLFGPNVPQYADDNAVMRLDDLCQEYGIREDQYIPAYWKINTYQGHIYCLPTTPADTALHYNAEMLRAAGFDPSRPPQTLQQMDDMAAKITRKENGKIVVSGFLPAEPGWWNWAWGCYFGGKLWDGSTKVTANSPENIAGFEWVQNYSKKYGPAELQTFKSGFGNFSSPQNAFMEKQVAMELQGVWMFNFVNKFAPGLPMMAAPFPHPENRPDLANVTIVDADVLVIPRGAKHPKEAFEFMAYVQKQEVMEKLCLSHQKNSPLRNVSDNFWKQHKNPYIRLFDKLAYSKNAVTTPRTGIWTEYQGEMTAAFDSIALLQKTPKQALDEVNERMQKKLDQYLLRLKARKAAGL